MEIAIVGAGPAGLITALQLHARGVFPKIYEAVGELKPLGVGVDIKPYGVAELDGIGLREAFEAMSVDAQESLFFNHFGQEIYAERCGTHMGYLYPQRFVHRGSLQMMLYDAVLERLGPDSVVVGARTVSYVSGSTGATIHLEYRDGRTSEVRADVVIAADGIKSSVRRQMHPESADPKYSGITMWRGTTIMEPFKTGGTILHIGDPRIASMIVYPIADDFEGTGKTLVNWVVEATRDETVEDWNQHGSADEILPLFDDTALPFLDVQQMLRDAHEVLLFPLIDHDPLDTWTDGRVVLLGDAAHAMYPRGGNGVCQAFVDARVIAEQLTSTTDPDEGIRAYQAARLEPVNRLVMANRGEAYEVIRRMVAERTDGEPFTDIEEVLPLAEADAIFSRYHALVGMPRPGYRADEATGFRSVDVTPAPFPTAEPAVTGVRAASPSVAAELLDVERRRQEALIAVDLDALDALFDDTLVHIHAPGLTHDKAQLLEHTATRRTYLEITRGDLDIRVVGDVAVVTGPITNRMRAPEGGERTLAGVATQVLVRDDEHGWRFVSFQMTPFGEQAWGALPSETPQDVVASSL
ncbi:MULTISPECIES: FAD-dependent monooxygenase [unclassified Curtobacterium]|uniref:FAD-dependent monooxygenase n=1 Tax=unclassified Curtobacterium TaxID=257496 RepID=UPI00381D8C31